MLNRSTRLDWLHLKSSTDIRQHGGAEWQRLGVVLLPTLVFCSEIEGSGVLQVWWEHNRFVTSFPRELYAKVPGIESDEGEVEVLRG